MTKTMSIRMDDDNYEFLNQHSKEEKADLSKAVRDLVDKGRVMLAVERYRKHEVSLGKAATLAGYSVSRMIDTLAEFGVEANLQDDDYRAGLEHLRKASESVHDRARSKHE